MNSTAANGVRPASAAQGNINNIDEYQMTLIKRDGECNLKWASRWRPVIVLMATVSLLAACATQQGPGTRPEATGTPQPSAAETESLRTVAAMQERLDRVAAPLLLNNPDLCKAHARNLLGFTAKNKYSYSNELANAAQAQFGLDEPLQVTSVVAGSGAAKAGLRPGDRLLMAEDRAMPQGRNAERQAAAVLAPLVNGHSAIKLTVLRNGANQILNIPLTRACGFRVELGNTDSVNSYADGLRVMVTRGMLEFTQSDEELAYVIAKEMAHNSLLHPHKLHINGTVGDIIDNLIRIHPDKSTLRGTAGIKPMPQELDAAADTLSLYMAARAGYNIDNATHFWQRLATKYPATVLNSHTALHPAVAYRLAALEKATAEIRSKQAGKKPLLP
jgi:beta-barrel assembly-enhancing protease